ncbi:MAG TPA: outer membrane beta-barrel protein [Vicinamibacterales bacterium]|jgi:hypothetical protein|nr:outer membrane beta-barrel protein [Vicinamibacterales bacterium]
MRHTARFLAASLVLIVTLLAARPANAQGFGLQGGFTYDTVSGDDDVLADIQGKSGWLVGLWYGGSAPVTFMGEMSYVTRETQNESGGKLKRTFLEFPTLLRINLGSSNYRVYPMGGPVFDIQLTAEDADGNSVDDSVNNYDIGILGGLGLQIARFAIEGRYVWGMTDILKSNVDFLEDLGLNETKNRSFQLVFKLRLN